MEYTLIKSLLFAEASVSLTSAIAIFLLWRRTLPWIYFLTETKLKCDAFTSIDSSQPILGRGRKFHSNQRHRHLWWRFSVHQYSRVSCFSLFCLTGWWIRGAAGQRCSASGRSSDTQTEVRNQQMMVPFETDISAFLITHIQKTTPQSITVHDTADLPRCSSPVIRNIQISRHGGNVTFRRPFRIC